MDKHPSTFPLPPCSAPVGQAAYLEVVRLDNNIWSLASVGRHVVKLEPLCYQDSFTNTTGGPTKIRCRPTKTMVLFQRFKILTL